MPPHEIFPIIFSSFLLGTFSKFLRPLPVSSFFMFYKTFDISTLYMKSL